MLQKLSAELLGTFWLVFGGCGSVIFAAHGIGLLGVSLAFGLTVLTMAYTIGPISGCHLNPAVSLGLWVGGRFNGRYLLPYIVAQVVGGLMAGGALYAIASGSEAFDVLAGFAANGYGEHSPNGYSLQSVFIAETLLTAMFLFIIMGVTDTRAPSGCAPVAIGLALTLIHLISIPISNTSVNPARSLGVAFYTAPWAMQQLWVFWVAPLIGGVLGAIAYRVLRPINEHG